MQCRICLDESDQEELISPCQCRGSAAFIHRRCLLQHIDHYPDGICRVCKTSFYRSTSISETVIVCFLVSFFTSIVTQSQLSLAVRGVLILAAIASVGMYSMFRMFDTTFAFQFLFLSVIPLIIGDASSIMMYLGFWILCTGIFLLLTYIPIHAIFTFLIVLFVSLYLGMFLLSILTLDLHAFVIALTASGMFLRVWVRYHPPLWMPAD